MLRSPGALLLSYYKMFGRVTAEGVRHAASRVKHHAIRAYRTTRHVASQIDHAMSVAARVYKAAQPALKHYAPEHEKKLTRHATRAHSRYDDMRQETTTADRMASGVAASISKMVPELRF